MLPLSEELLRQYETQGYLLVSGLIPDIVAARAEAALWHELNATPEDRASWGNARTIFKAFENPDLVACYTPEMLAAAAQLAGDAPETIPAPTHAFAINVFPSPDVWKWPAPHIDHAIKEHGHKTFPRAFRVAAMTFLNAVAPHGAGTIVWPGSHRKIEHLAKSDPVRYELMWSLNQDILLAEIGDPVETTPKRGDVLFYHYLCAHAGSQNTSDRPRFALNAKW